MSKKEKRIAQKTASQNRSNSRSHWALTSILLTSTVATSGIAKMASAQETGRPTSDRRGGSQLPVQHFDIPAGPLDTALASFETAAGVSLDLRVMTLRGLQSPGVAGDFTPEQALQRLLAGSSIEYHFLDPKKIVLGRRRPTDHGNSEATRFAAVSVTAQTPPGRVTSPKYTEPPRNTPQTITVVPKEVIEAQGATSLRDVMRNVSGITINAGEGGSTPGDKFNIRGFSAASDIFVDGVRDVSGYSREVFNLEQVEVSKGPNSSVTGRGATGGSINMMTKTPSLRGTAIGTFTMGTADQRRATIDINQPLARAGSPSAAVRLNAMISSGGVPGDEVISNKGWGVAPSLELGLGKPTQLLISYLRSGQDNIPAYGIENFNAVPTFDTRKFYGLRSLDFERVATNQLTLRVDHDFSSSMHLRNQFTRGHSESDRIVTSVNPVATKPDSGRRSSKTHINGNDDLTNQTNLSIAFATGGISHDVATGVEISRENSLYGRYTINGTAPAIANLANPTADADYHPTLTLQPARVVRATSLGAYAFETMKIGSKLELNGGLRWDRYTPVYVDSLSRASGFEAKQASALTGRAAVVVKPTEYGSVYVSYGTSFNPSNQNLSADALDKNSALPPEKNISYEIGSKWDLFKERLSATMALFRTDKTNARTTDPADPTTTTILAGKQRVQGGEVGVTGNITPKWNVLAGYSRLNSKVLESLNPAQLNTSLLNVPKHSVTTWTSYQVTRDLEIGGGARYLDKRLLRINGATSIYVPSYHTYDATASYRFNPSIDLRLNLYNLTDKLYYDSGRMWVPAAGRSVAVTTSVKL